LRGRSLLLALSLRSSLFKLRSCLGLGPVVFFFCFSHSFFFRLLGSSLFGLPGRFLFGLLGLFSHGRRPCLCLRLRLRLRLRISLLFQIYHAADERDKHN
jgi:hypothetical protein